MPAATVTTGLYGQLPDLLDIGIDHVYVHEGAFSRLAGASEQDARETFMFMGALQLQGVIGNIFGPLGDPEHEHAWSEGGGMTIEDATSLLLARDKSRFIDPFLQSTAMHVISKSEDASPGGKLETAELLVPIGGPIVDQCWEEFYFTYGFTGPGAYKMRHEKGSMRELAATTAAGAGPDGLAVAHGPNGKAFREGEELESYNAAALWAGEKAIGDYLVPVAIDIGSGGSVAYVEQRRPAERMPFEAVTKQDKAMRKGIVMTADIRIGMVNRKLDEQRKKIGSERHKNRVAHLQVLKKEIDRVLSSHRLVHEQHYRQSDSD